MAERVLQHTATIPAGTAADNPYTSDCGFTDWDVERIDLEVPPGPAGVMGFYLANNDLPWVPRSAGEWLVWDDQKLTVYPTGYPVGTGWQIIGYNTGAYDHAVICRFHVNPPPAPSSAVQAVPLTFEEIGVPVRAPVTL